MGSYFDRMDTDKLTSKYSCDRSLPYFSDSKHLYEFCIPRILKYCLGAFRIEVFNVIIDTCAPSFNNCFNPKALDILQYLMFLDPRSFHTIQKDGLPNALNKLTASL